MPAAKGSSPRTPLSELVNRLRAYIPVEGQEGLAVRDGLMREAASAIESLREQVMELRQEIRDTARDVATEANWKHAQGEDYGSY